MKRRKTNIRIKSMSPTVSEKYTFIHNRSTGRATLVFLVLLLCSYPGLTDVAAPPCGGKGCPTFRSATFSQQGGEVTVQWRDSPTTEITVRRSVERDNDCRSMQVFEGHLSEVDISECCDEYEYVQDSCWRECGLPESEQYMLYEIRDQCVPPGKTTYKFYHNHGDKWLMYHDAEFEVLDLGQSCGECESDFSCAVSRIGPRGGGVACLMLLCGLSFIALSSARSRRPRSGS